jgi:hypothetical protein
MMDLKNKMNVMQNIINDMKKEIEKLKGEEN